jgi:probable F420-dependent oxidoreductase
MHRGGVEVKFVFNYPETSGLESDLLDSGEISDVARAVEAAGFDAFALTEHPIPGANWLAHGGHQTLDPFVGLAFAAAVTERIQLLTHLSVAPYRNPFMLAKTAATLDRLSQGRFILGLGAGYHKTEFFALGVDFDERNALFDEALELLPKAWSGEPFDAQGIHFTAKGVIQRPRPARVPIPIWIGGNSKLSRRRVAERAQGWMPMGGPPQLSATARTPAIGSLDELGKMEAAGLTYVNVGHPPTTPQQMLDFIQAFGETYIAS